MMRMLSSVASCLLATVCLWLVASCAVASGASIAAGASHHCRYADLLSRRLLNSTNVDIDAVLASGAPRICQREIESTNFPSCCNPLIEHHLWTTTVDSYNDAFQSLANHKLSSIQRYLSYLAGEHVQELASHVLRIPELLNKTGQYEMNEFGRAMQQFGVDVAEVFQRLAANQASVRDITVILMEHSETVIRVLIERHVLQQDLASQPALRELMHSVLADWVSEEDRIVLSLFDMVQPGNKLINALVSFNQTLLALRKTEEFWQAASRNALANRDGLVSGNSSDSLTQCIRNLVQLTKCQFCSISTKDSLFCPQIFINQTTCLSAYLQPIEQEYATLMAYFRALLVGYNRLYADFVYQFAEFQVYSIRNLVKNRTVDIIEAAIKQFKRRDRFLLDEEEQATEYLNMLKSRTRFALFTEKELLSPVPIPIKQLITVPLIRMAANFTDSPGQFSILGPLHNFLLKSLTVTSSPSSASSGRCWNGRDVSGSLPKRYNITSVVFDQQWASTARKLNDTLGCFICIVQNGISECDICYSEDPAFTDSLTSLSTSSTTAFPPPRSTTPRRIRKTLSTTRKATPTTTMPTTTTTTTSTLPTSTARKTTTTSTTTPGTTPPAVIEPEEEDPPEDEFDPAKVVESNLGENYEIEAENKEHARQNAGPDDEDTMLEASGSDGGDCTEVPESQDGENEQPEQTDSTEQTEQPEQTEQTPVLASTDYTSSAQEATEISASGQSRLESLGSQSQESQPIRSAAARSFLKYTSFFSCIIIYAYAMRLR